MTQEIIDKCIDASKPKLRCVTSAYRAILVINSSNRYTQYVFVKYGLILINQKKLWQFHWMGHFFAHSCIFIWQYLKYTISITVLVCQSIIASVLIGFVRVSLTKTRQKEKWNLEIWGWFYFGGNESCILWGDFIWATSLDI